MVASQTAPASARLGTRERILRATSRLVLSHGYGGTSTRAIAADVGIRQPSLFHHFESKRAIVRELLERDLQPALARARHFAELPGPAAPRIYAYIVADLRALHGWPYDVRSIYTTELLRNPDFVDQRRTYEQLVTVLRVMIDDALADREFLPVEAAHVQQMIGGVFLAAIWAPSMVTGSELLNWPEQSAGIVIRGLLRDYPQFDRVRRAGDVLVDEFERVG
ncbi:MAG: TetR/AcrR family transcriptional regulator [Solirubrobacteraceae bacterium]